VNKCNLESQNNIELTWGYNKRRYRGFFST